MYYGTIPLDGSRADNHMGGFFSTNITHAFQVAYGGAEMYVFTTNPQDECHMKAVENEERSSGCKRTYFDEVIRLTDDECKESCNVYEQLNSQTNWVYTDPTHGVKFDLHCPRICREREKD
jgi:hypothetical protein